MRQQGYKLRLLPSFHNHDAKAWALQRKIIASYRGHRVVFQAEQDQFLRHLETLREDYRRKFNAARAREHDALLSVGEKICPPDFWHGYPESPHWHVADKSGHVAWKDQQE